MRFVVALVFSFLPLSVAAQGIFPSGDWHIVLNDGWSAEGSKLQPGWWFACGRGSVTNFDITLKGQGALGATNFIRFRFEGYGINADWERPADGGSFSLSNLKYTRAGSLFKVTDIIPSNPFLSSHHHCGKRKTCGQIIAYLNFVCDPKPTPSPTPTNTTRPTRTPTRTPAPTATTILHATPTTTPVPVFTPTPIVIAKEGGYGGYLISRLGQ